MGLFSATAIVMGSMIGSGIFIVSADMSRTLGSPALLIAAWLVTAAMTIIGALSYGELAAMMPKAGGQYVYLREALGPLWGFLYGWTLFLVIQTGTIAAVGVAFGKFLGVFFPAVSQANWIWHVGSGNVGLNTANLAAIAIITLLTSTTRGSEAGRIGAECVYQREGAGAAGRACGGAGGEECCGVGGELRRGWANFWAGAGWHSLHAVEVGSFCMAPMVLVGLLTVIAVVQVGSAVFSADAWNNVTFTAGEIRDPKRNLPLSSGDGHGRGAAAVYRVQLCLSQRAADGRFADGDTIAGRGIQYAAQDRVATAVMEAAFGALGAKLMAAAILISTFGCVNGMLLAGARVYYAMSRDGLFFKGVGKLEREERRAGELAVGAVGVDLPAVPQSGSYGQLLDYVIFAVLVFYILTIVGLFVLRRTQPDAPRPYRAFGYPVLPALYIAMAAWISVVLLRYKPQYTWPGLILVLLGVPVYLVWKRQGQGTRNGIRS